MGKMRFEWRQLPVFVKGFNKFFSVSKQKCEGGRSIAKA